MERIQNPHILPVGMQSGAATVENILAVPQYVNHTITVRSSNSISKEFHLRNLNLRPHKNLYMSVHSIIHSSQKMKLSQMSISW